MTVGFACADNRRGESDPRRPERKAAYGHSGLPMRSVVLTRERFFLISDVSSRRCSRSLRRRSRS